MKTFFQATLLLILAAAFGVAMALYVRPAYNLEPVVGDGFDPSFVAPDRTAEIEARRAGHEAESGAPSAGFSEFQYWVKRNNDGLKALDEGDFATACAYLEECVEAHPEQKIYSQNLVEALSRLARGLWDQGDRKEAIWKLERAVEICATLNVAAQRPDLVRLLERWQREFAVEGDFWQDTSQHFELSYDASHADLANGFQDVIDLLETAYADLRDFFGEDPVFNRGRRLQVVLYRRSNFDTVTGLDAWAGGAFDGSIRVPVKDLAAEMHGLDPLLRHELVHAFVQDIGGMSVPAWFNEGLAQWISGEREMGLRRAQQLFTGPDAQPFFTMEELGGSFSRWTDETEVKRAYTQSVVLVDALANRYGERLLASLCAEGKNGEQGIAKGYEARMGRTLDDFWAEVELDFGQ
jgi:tetratricopeptide (TPR) repeat protein